jgi:hypothetical protein
MFELIENYITPSIALAGLIYGVYLFTRSGQDVKILRDIDEGTIFTICQGTKYNLYYYQHSEVYAYKEKIMPYKPAINYFKKTLLQKATIDNVMDKADASVFIDAIILHQKNLALKRDKK